MTTDRGGATAPGWAAGRRRTIAAAVCLAVSAAACAAYVARPHYEARGTVPVVANPVYVAADATAVAPRALTTKALKIPAGASVAVEPGPASVLRITVTAEDSVTAQDVANAVLDRGLPAALRVQVAEGLRVRKTAGAASPKVTAAEVDAAMAAYRLRVVTVTRALGTTPSGAEAVQAVAVAQVGGLPAATMDPAVASRLVVDALQGEALDAVRGARSAGVEVRAAGGPAVGVAVDAGSAQTAGGVARDVVAAASSPLERLLRSSGLPAETLVLQPYVTPLPVRTRPAPPWWLTTLLVLVALGSLGAVLLDRRDRARTRPARAA
ncbi:MAG: hypothetical protein HY830_00345, partial [Actinobacteria bacterium]|nr:hypothetical protein [Actinomycetota bacterium]